MSLRTPLANARNHGPAGDGVAHWWAQRFSAIAMIGLVAWLVWALLSVAGASHAEAAAWVGQPFNASMAILFSLVSIYHSRLGLQVIIEDYVHQRGVELALQIVIKLAALLAAALAVMAILKVALGA